MSKNKFGFDVTIVMAPTTHIKVSASNKEEAEEKIKLFLEGKNVGGVSRGHSGASIDSLDSLTNEIVRNPDSVDLEENIVGVRIQAFEYADDDSEGGFATDVFFKDFGISNLLK